VAQANNSFTHPAKTSATADLAGRGASDQLSTRPILRPIQSQSMPSRTDPRVDAYIAKAAVFARPVLQHLRKLVHAGCPEVGETIKWGHVSFVYRGQIFAGMAAFKGHLSFGFWHQKMENILARDGFRTGDAMGLMGRIARRADLPDDRTMLRYVKTAAAFHDSGVRARPAPKPKPVLKTPTDLAAALKKDKGAAVTWKKFSPSHRREYVEWLTEAKRDETRQKRLATALEWLVEGKPRNWKYLNC
jgi:uncharacterized protein YdeI (YjbR/CyaY-like superfamily)